MKVTSTGFNSLRKRVAGVVRRDDTWHFGYRTFSASSALPNRMRFCLEAFMVASLPLRGMVAFAAFREDLRC